MSDNSNIKSLLLIAGKGSYPLQLAQTAKKNGVERLVILAFKGETKKELRKYGDEYYRVSVGQVGKTIEIVKKLNLHHAVMAGQITPTNIFNLRMDQKGIELIKSLPSINPDTVFGALADILKDIDIELMPASMFMEDHMPTVGTLSQRYLTNSEMKDANFGLKIAAEISALNIGQTVVVKDLTVLAVEAFEGTDRTIKRGGAIGGANSVIIKVAREGIDMRFDIPVIGLKTVKAIKKSKASAIVIESEKCILLEKEKVVEALDKLNVAFVVVPHEAKTSEKNFFSIE
jgi:UDP-2,3-diacylglucosamine hydrolase